VSEGLAALAAETEAIVAAGRYGEVEIGADVAAAVAGTRLFLPTDDLPAPPGPPGPVHVEVTPETSLAAARRLAAVEPGQGDREPAVLNFASARNPGGGFRGGARAQEESLARASALVVTLESKPGFYRHHRADKDLRYSDRVIHSPGVPVFRDDDGALLDELYQVAFLTAAAPNAGAIRRNQPRDAGSIPEVLERRAARVLDIAAALGHRRLVLGAWGCGVFENDPETVARAFRTALAGERPFDLVVFAVLDTRKGAPTRAAFERVLRP
jgi:uncharacterized protein (TIGR02452 family)